ncbi:hypothetical protein RRF57_009235 [Xylaria bambusicola]|uniref:Uncharacterized protein n=1 Tax=Xylaria bambusicola TaxID=326684 RepID=A0AAN7UWI4_9PEZI
MYKPSVWFLRNWLKKLFVNVDCISIILVPVTLPRMPPVPAPRSSDRRGKSSKERCIDPATLNHPLALRSRGHVAVHSASQYAFEGSKAAISMYGASVPVWLAEPQKGPSKLVPATKRVSLAVDWNVVAPPREWPRMPTRLTRDPGGNVPVVHGVEGEDHILDTDMKSQFDVIRRVVAEAVVYEPAVGVLDYLGVGRVVDG